MTRHSAGNLIFLLVFALLCGDWAEPAKARAAVGGHKALSKLLPASSKVSTDNILLAQARKGNNGNGQGGGTCNNDNNNQNQSGQDCGDLNSGVSGAAEEPTGQPIVNADQSETSDIELLNQFFVTDKGGTIDNNGVNLILEGSIQSIGDTSDAPSPLFFDGPGSTSLQGNNSYLNPTTEIIFRKNP